MNRYIFLSLFLIGLLTITIHVSRDGADNSNAVADGNPLPFKGRDRPVLREVEGVRVG